MAAQAVYLAGRQHQVRCVNPCLCLLADSVIARREGRGGGGGQGVQYRKACGPTVIRIQYTRTVAESQKSPHDMNSTQDESGSKLYHSVHVVAASVILLLFLTRTWDKQRSAPPPPPPKPQPCNILG